MGSTTTTMTMAPPPAPRQRAIKPALFPSLKASTSAAGQTSSAAAPRKSGRRTTATARAGGSIAVASRGSNSSSSASTKPAPQPPSRGRVFAAPHSLICGPIYVPWESAEPPALCCGTRKLLAHVAAQASQGNAGRVVKAAAPPPLAPKPIAVSHSFPPLLSPSSSSTSSSHRQPSPISHEIPAHPDFLSSLTHLAYPSPVSSTPTPPASSSTEHDFSISAPTPLTLSDYPSQEPVLSFEEEMLAGPFDLSTFSRPGSPLSFTELKQEEDLAVLSEVKQEEESSFWTVGRETTSRWAW